MSATPSSRGQTTTTTSDIEIPPLPPYQPPAAPLIPNCQQKLTNLAKSNTLKHLHTHIQHAAEKLTDSAGDVNERLTEVREKALRSRKRNRAQFEDGQQDEGNRGEGENEEDHRLQETEEEVKAVTARLEEGIRRIVDAEVLVDGLSGVLTDLSKAAEQDAAASTASASTSTARRLRRRLNPHNNDSDEEEEEEEEDDDEPSQSQPQSQPPTPYTKTLTQKLKTEAANWSNQSLTQRYSTNNTYIGFYRMVHDAKHPGNDIPPLPHASTWFRHLEGAAGSNNVTPGEGSEDDDGGARAHSIQPKHEPENNDDDDDDEEGEEEEEEEEELEIASERISLKCPLTLLTFQEPLTSTKCPHSFEKQAILDMISHSSTTVPPSSGGGRNRVRAVKCPVCSVLLTAQDLRKDAVLLRRVRRMEAMMQREEEEDEDEDGGGRRRRSKGMRKSGITVGSDEDEDDEEEEEEESEEEQPVRIKRERTAG